MKYEIHQLHEHEWCFSEPKCVTKSIDKFNEATDSFDFGTAEETEALLRAILKKCPIHIDALHHLAIILDNVGLEIEAYLLEKEAANIGLAALGHDFNFKQERLIWGYLDNRPFLRAYHGYALALLKRKQKAEAREIFENILATNPNDNQGIRGILPELLFDAKEPARVLAISEAYPDDTDPGPLYGAVLALVQMDRPADAQAWAKIAVSRLPSIAHELLKERHIRPPSEHPGYIVHGGAEQAYEYWSCYGKYWSKTPGALELLRTAIR